MPGLVTRRGSDSEAPYHRWVKTLTYHTNRKNQKLRSDHVTRLSHTAALSTHTNVDVDATHIRDEPRNREPIAI